MDAFFSSLLEQVTRPRIAARQARVGVTRRPARATTSRAKPIISERGRGPRPEIGSASPLVVTVPSNVRPVAPQDELRLGLSGVTGVQEQPSKRGQAEAAARPIPEAPRSGRRRVSRHPHPKRRDVSSGSSRCGAEEGVVRTPRRPHLVVGDLNRRRRLRRRCAAIRRDARPRCQRTDPRTSPPDHGTATGPPSQRNPGPGPNDHRNPTTTSSGRPVHGSPEDSSKHIPSRTGTRPPPAAAAGHRLPARPAARPGRTPPGPARCTRRR